MFIKDLELHNFRNIKSSKVSFNSRLNIFCGKNGQGKTSFVEGIYFLSCGKSFRTNQKKELINNSSDQSLLKTTVVRANDIQSSLQAELTATGSLKLKLNEKDKKLSDGYLGQLLTVSFCPTDLEIIRAEPNARRRFMDKHLSDIYPGYLPTLIRFNKALKTKNTLLAEQNLDTRQLDPWDQLIAETSEQLFKYRQKFLSELEELVANILPLFASSDGKVSFEFISNCCNKETGLSSQEIFAEILNSRSKEIYSRRSLIGAHRDDFTIKLSALSAREYSSQGQARSLVLLLKLGVAELIEQKTNQQPVIILDDVDSELDSGRARFIFDIFSEKNRQIFISSTASTRSFFPENAEFFEVSAGQVISK